MARRLPALLGALALAFAFFAGLTFVARPPGATLVLGTLDAAGAIVLGVAAFRARRRGVRPRAANGAASAAILFALFASLVAVKLLHLPAQSSNVILLVILASLVLLSPRWLALVLAFALVGWGAVAASEGLPGSWVNASANIVVAATMAVIIQLVRLRDARGYEALRARERQRAVALERSVENLEAFSFVIAHDLKEPIRATDLYLHEAVDATDPAERRDLLAKASASHARLARLVNGLLEWSRATTTPIEPVEVDVAALLQDPATRAMFERLLEERAGRLVIEAPLPRALGTSPLVRQVLGNLILNALKHGTKARPLVRVRGEPATAEGLVVLVVEDDGPGFPARVLVGPGDRAPARLGEGFGLRIARRAVERLGGSIELANAPEGGARVRVLLPAPGGAARQPLARPGII